MSYYAIAYDLMNNVAIQHNAIQHNMTQSTTIQSNTMNRQGVRSAVAECLGVLTSIHGERLVPVLLEMAKVEDDKLAR